MLPPRSHPSCHRGTGSSTRPTHRSIRSRSRPAPAPADDTFVSPQPPHSRAGAPYCVADPRVGSASRARPLPPPTEARRSRALPPPHRSCRGPCGAAQGATPDQIWLRMQKARAKGHLLARLVGILPDISPLIGVPFVLALPLGVRIALAVTAIVLADRPRTQLLLILPELPVA